MIKKLIFIFVFLCGMFFTVIRYFPSLEEETPGHRVELAKKMKQSDPMDGDNDSSDGDNDDDTESDFDYFLSPSYKHFFAAQKIAFSHSNFLCKYQVGNIHTPPPKI